MSSSGSSSNVSAAFASAFAVRDALPLWQRAVYHILALGLILIWAYYLNGEYRSGVGSDWGLSFLILVLCFQFPKRMLGLGWGLALVFGLVAGAGAFYFYSFFNYLNVLPTSMPNAQGFAGFWGYGWLYGILGVLQEGIGLAVHFVAARRKRKPAPHVQ